jgi:hypothetical protein
VSKLTKLLRSPAKPAHFCVRWRAARPRKKCLNVAIGEVPSPDSRQTVKNQTSKWSSVKANAPEGVNVTVEARTSQSLLGAIGSKATVRGLGLLSLASSVVTIGRDPRAFSRLTPNEQVMVLQWGIPLADIEEARIMFGRPSIYADEMY